ncbi:MAG: YfhO family protein [Anaerolineae bacterium]
MNNDSTNLRSPISNLLDDFMAIVLLWLLVIASFWRIALAGRVLASGDVFTYFYPYWAEATRAVRAGRLPLWNPYLFMGAPFLANSQVGFFYPLNWPLWLLLPAHQSVHLTIVLHLCLAALNGYLWGRTSLRLGRVGAWTVGATFALGGYLGAQVEHVNQLQGLAWLPLMLMLYDMILVKVEDGSAKQKRLRLLECLQLLGSPATLASVRCAFAGLAIVVGLVLLAGHTQTAFISLVGLAAYGLGLALWRGVRQREWRPLARRAALLAAVAGLGMALAAVQLIPTWELSRLSVRSEGLPFNERVSFSLSPFYLARALLPGFAEPVPPEHIEHVAYVGIAGLALAAIAICNAQHATRNLQSAIFLLALGLFLSLGLYNPLYLLLARYVPGFAHFRVPARWLALYAAGVAALAGWGADRLFHRRGRVGWRGLLSFAVVLVALATWAVVGVRIGEGGRVGWSNVVGWAAATVLALGLLMMTRRAPRWAAVGLLVLLIVELFTAGTSLPHSRATAPQAFTSLRPAIAHLLASNPPAPLAREGQGGGSRFISMSDITFDPGDLPEIEAIYGPQLSADALYDYIIAAKHKEVLSPDLPLAFGIPAVDGYDGGVLPLARYVALQHLFLPEGEVSIDGRLRENLSAIPAGRWLSLFNVRYIITDKLRDAWLDDVFYDLQFGAHLERGESAAVAHVPQFEATALGVVSYLRGAAALPDGAVVGVVEVGFGEGITCTFELRAGEHTAEGLYGPSVAHAQAPVGDHLWPPALSSPKGQVEGGQPEGNDYVTRLRWPDSVLSEAEGAAAPATVVVRATLPEGELVVRGVSLIDERTGGFQALVLSDQGRFRLAHSGDVKIYENLDVLGPAFLVHEALVAADDEEALALMRDAAFDPAAKVVLSGETWRRFQPSPGCELLLGPRRSSGVLSLSKGRRFRSSSEAYRDQAGYAKPLAWLRRELSRMVSICRSLRSQLLNQRSLNTASGLSSIGCDSIRVTHYAPERVEIEVAAEAPGYLVLTDAWYPGWEAMVDGESVVVHRANLLFRAIVLDAGEHCVVFTFRPTSLHIGAGVSLVGLVGLIVAALALSKARHNDIMHFGKEAER